MSGAAVNAGDEDEADAAIAEAHGAFAVHMVRTAVKAYDDGRMTMEAFLEAVEIAHGHVWPAWRRGWAFLYRLKEPA